MHRQNFFSALVPRRRGCKSSAFGTTTRTISSTVKSQNCLMATRPKLACQSIRDVRNQACSPRFRLPTRERQRQECQPEIESRAPYPHGLGAMELPTELSVTESEQYRTAAILALPRVSSGCSLTENLSSS